MGYAVFVVFCIFMIVVIILAIVATMWCVLYLAADMFKKWIDFKKQYFSREIKERPDNDNVTNDEEKIEI
jgi:hypothetical protein